MKTEDDGSVTNWIVDLKAGREEAVQRIWDRYFERLVELARKKLRKAPKISAEADEEDAAISAFKSICMGASRGRFPNLSDRDDLWRLLVVITARKLVDQIKHERRVKRGGGKVIMEADLSPSKVEAGSFQQASLDNVVGDEPPPEFAVLMAEQFQLLFDRLPDENLRRIAIDKMEGYTDDEIAQRHGVSRRTVVRKLDMIRRCWIEFEKP